MPEATGVQDKTRIIHKLLLQYATIAGELVLC